MRINQKEISSLSPFISAFHVKTTLIPFLVTISILPFYNLALLLPHSPHPIHPFNFLQTKISCFFSSVTSSFATSLEWQRITRRKGYSGQELKLNLLGIVRNRKREIILVIFLPSLLSLLVFNGKERIT